MVIPGLWTQHVSEKESKQCSWLKLLVASTDNDTRVFIFKYDIQTKTGEDGNVWHQLLALGRFLLDALRQARPFEVGRLSRLYSCHRDELLVTLFSSEPTTATILHMS